MHGSDAPAELGRDLRRDDRRIDGIGQGALESPRGPLPRHATRRGAARSAAPRSASSTCWPSPPAYLHDHITPLACEIPGAAHSTDRGSQVATVWNAPASLEALACRM